MSNRNGARVVPLDAAANMASAPAASNAHGMAAGRVGRRLGARRGGSEGHGRETVSRFSAARR